MTCERPSVCQKHCIQDSCWDDEYIMAARIEKEIAQAEQQQAPLSRQEELHLILAEAASGHLVGVRGRIG